MKVELLKIPSFQVNLINQPFFQLERFVNLENITICDVKEAGMGPPTDGGIRGRKKLSSRGHHKYVGVRRKPSGRWVEEIKDSPQKVRLWLGTFDTAGDAARAYDTAARALRGANDRTNF